MGHAPEPAADADGDAEAADDEDEDFEAAIPSWVPDGRPARGHAWLAAVRADPGRAGGIALAVVAVLAVLITVFTLIRHRPAPVVSANLPPVEMVSVGAVRIGPGRPSHRRRGSRWSSVSSGWFSSPGWSP